MSWNQVIKSAAGKCAPIMQHMANFQRAAAVSIRFVNVGLIDSMCVESPSMWSQLEISPSVGSHDLLSILTRTTNSASGDISLGLIGGPMDEDGGR